MKKGRNGIFIHAFSILIVFAFNWYLTQRLGVEEYGIFTYAFSWLFFFSGISNIGLDTLIQRELVRYERPLVLKILHFSRKNTFLISIVILIIYSGICWSLIENKNYSSQLILAFSALPAMALMMLNKSACIGLKRLEAALTPENIWRPLIALILMVAVFEYTGDLALNTAIILNIIGVIVSLGVSFYLVQKGLKHFDFTGKISSTESSSWYRAGWTFLFITLISAMNARADILMLGLFGKTAEVGIYNIAAKLSTFIALPLAVLNMILSPLISKYYQSQREHLMRTIKSSFRVVFILGLIGCALFWLIGKWILGIFGPEYIQGFYVLVFLAFGQLIGIAFGPVSNLLNMTEYENLALRGMVISTAINILLNLILIPIYGMEGAAIATFINLIAWNIMLYYYVRVKLKLQPSIF